MKRPGSRILLIAEQIPGGSWGDVLPLPADGVAWIQFDAEQSPRLIECPAENSIAMQVLDGEPLRIALRSDGGGAVINAVIAPPVAVARPGDEIQMEQCRRWRLHVALRHTAAASRAGEEMAGRECPVCRDPFKADDAVWRCRCGTVVHSQDSDEPNAEFSCIRALSNCPDCGQEIRLEESVNLTPEGFDVAEYLQSSRGSAALAGQ